MAADDAPSVPVADKRVVYAVGMEVPVGERTPPESRPDPLEWAPYFGLRFSRGVRVVASVAVLFLPTLFVFAAVVQIVMGEGEVRAGSAILLMPVVVMVPVAWWALRDLWGRHR